jgi:hypothetical protein
LPLRPRPEPFRSLRILALAALLFMAGQLAVGAALDRAPNWVRFPQGEKAVSSAVRLERPFVALFGSSRFRNLDRAVMAAEMQEALGEDAPPIVQASVLAGDPIVAEFLLRAMLARGARPDLVVLELSPETLSAPAHWIGDHVTRFYTAADIVRNLREIQARGRLEDTLARRFNATSFYRFELLRWLTEERPPYLRVPPPDTLVPTPVSGRRPRAEGHAAGPAGVQRVAAKPEGNAKTVSGLRRVRRWLEDYAVGGAETRALAELVARCRAEGIEIVLVGVPVGSWQRALYEGPVDTLFHGFLDPFVESNGLAFFDHRASIPDALFEDNHHLSPEGGRVFGAQLVREVIAPAWSNEGRAARSVVARR